MNITLKSDCLFVFHNYSYWNMKRSMMKLTPVIRCSNYVILDIKIVKFELVSLKLKFFQ